MILTLPIGIMGSNCIVIFDQHTKIGAVVDPGMLNASPLLDVISAYQIELNFVLNTHGHFDHIAGNHLIPRPFTLAVHPADLSLLLSGGSAAMFGLDYPKSPPPDMELEDNQIIDVGGTILKVIHTPGHTPGCVSFYVEQEQTIVTGDTLFQGSVGRTDLPGGNEHTLIKSLESYLTLPDTTIVLPGHGPSSTIKEEKLYNPWLRSILQR